MQEKPVETSHHIRTNHPVSQSYIYQTPLVHDSPASRTEQHKQPPCSVRDAIPETLRVLPGKTATTPVPADLLKLKISQSLIIYHSFHQSIQIFNSPPVPMLLFKHKKPIHPKYSTNSNALSAIPLQLLQTTQNADPLPSSFSKIKRVK